MVLRRTFSALETLLSARSLSTLSLLFLGFFGETLTLAVGVRWNPGGDALLFLGVVLHLQGVDLFAERRQLVLGRFTALIDVAEDGASFREAGRTMGGWISG